MAAYEARSFFDQPNIRTFDELLKAAKTARVEASVRAVALRFLETGIAPYRVTSATKAQPARSRTSTRGKKTKPAPAATSPQLKIDSDWPLPVPDALIPMLTRPVPYPIPPRPHLDVLLSLAIIAKQPEEVLRWYDAILKSRRSQGIHPGVSNADAVAVAVAATHPERAIEIYINALNTYLPTASPAAYDSATRYFKLLRPLYDQVNRLDDWKALLATVREKYRGRPNFMKLLDVLDDKPIVGSVWTRRK